MQHLALLLMVLATRIYAVEIRSVVPDSTAPEAIADLAASVPTASTCDLDWTAPSEDGASGGAVTSYDCRRRSGATFVEGDWAGATQLTGEPTPSAPDSAEGFTASGLSSATQYAFACKSADEAANISAISNAATCTTTGVTFYDSFDRADETTVTGWNEIVSPASTAIATNQLAINGGATAEALYATPTSGLGQFGSVQITGTLTRPAIVFRAENSYPSNRYVLRYDGAYQWRDCNAASGADCQPVESVGDSALQLNDYMGFEIDTATGTSTVVRAYRCTADPCAVTPTKPSASGSCTLAATFTADPTREANTGLYVGLAQKGAGNNTFDNFCGGTLY